jgi:hypothetical protein
MKTFLITSFFCFFALLKICKAQTYSAAIEQPFTSETSIRNYHKINDNLFIIFDLPRDNSNKINCYLIKNNLIVDSIPKYFNEKLRYFYVNNTSTKIAVFYSNAIIQYNIENDRFDNKFIIYSGSDLSPNRINNIIYFNDVNKTLSLDLDDFNLSTINFSDQVFKSQYNRFTTRNDTFFHFVNSGAKKGFYLEYEKKIIKFLDFKEYTDLNVLDHPMIYNNDIYFPLLSNGLLKINIKNFEITHMSLPDARPEFNFKGSIASYTRFNHFNEPLILLSNNTIYSLKNLENPIFVIPKNTTSLKSILADFATDSKDSSVYLCYGEKLIKISLNEASRLKKVENLASFTIFPNPTENGFTLNIDNFNNNGKCKLQILDINGKEILNKNILESQSYISLPQNLQNGTYLVKVLNKDEVSTTKLILNK